MSAKYKTCSSLIISSRMLNFGICLRCSSSRCLRLLLKAKHLPKRCYGSKATPAGNLVYVSPRIKTIMPFKVLSMVTGVAVVLGSPVLVVLDKSDVPAVARFAMCGMLIMFGIGTTAMCHWYLNVHVTRMFYDVSRGMITAETIPLFSSGRQYVFHVREACGLPSKGLASGFGNFQVNSKPFYVHPEPEVFKDRVLLAKLLRQPIL